MMQRGEREITQPERIVSILQAATICRIALCDGQRPYLIPMNFVYFKEQIYLHSAREGKKMEILKKNNHICFEVEGRTRLLPGKTPCSYGMAYESVIGFGEAFLVEDFQEKEEGLAWMMEKYGGTQGAHFSQQALEKVAVIRIKITELTGKEAGF